jgi:hypothetical protein
MDYHRLLDRGLYLFLALWMWVIALAGFWPGYVGPAVDGSLDKTGAVHFHVFIYVGWLILFTLQAALPMFRRGRLHRRIGRFGIGYGVVVWIVGLTVTWSRFAERVRLGNLEEARSQVLPPLTDMLIFPVLFVFAIYYRDRPEIHKRWMVLAATMLLVAAVARMTINGVLPANPLVFDFVWLSPIWIAMLHDGWFRRRLHPVYGYGFLALGIVPFRMLLIETQAWRDITAWVAERFVS